MTTAGQPEPSSEPDGRTAEDGDLVKVHYHGTLDSGDVFDSSYGAEPLEFTVGTGQVIGGFDSAVRGLAVGGRVKVRMDAADAYGDRDEELVFRVPTESAPPGLRAGDRVRMSGGMTATVTEVAVDTITVDANHPLAGQALTFEIELVGLA